MVRNLGWLFLLWLVLAGVSRGLDQPSQDLPRIVRVVLDQNYPPYSFRSEAGKLQGILIDQWALWEKRTGIPVELHGLDWADALRGMRAGEFDVIACIVETTERKEYFEFTAPFVTIDTPIFFRRDISGITDIASLRGFPVGVKAGDQRIDKLKSMGITTLIPYQNHDAIVDAAKQRAINIFIFDAQSAHYLLNRAGIDQDFRESGVVFRDEIRRGVRKGDTALLNLVSKGFAAIDPKELARIDEKWFGRTINRSSRYLAFAGYAAAIATFLVVALAIWNRLLRTKVLERTQALSESEQRFRQITDNIREVVWLATIDLSKILYVSPAYETVWGRSCESLYRNPRSFIETIHPEDRDRAISMIDTTHEHGFELEYRLLRADGSIRWIRVRAFPIKDQNDRTYRVAGICEDMTERKLAEDAFKQAEDRVRLIIDTIPTMVWSIEPDGRIDFVNQRWLDYTGLSLEREREKPTEIIQAEDLAGVMHKWLANFSAGETSEDEMRLRRADGTYRWFMVRTAPFRDKSGKIVKWFGSSIEIEDRKEAEEALRRSKQQLHELVGRLNTVREEEAKRIARELHDDLGQKLTAVNMGLAELDRKLIDATPAQREQIDWMHDTVDQTIEAVQNLSSELRLGQLDILGLTAAIDWQLKEFTRHSGIPCVVTRLDEITTLPDAHRTAVFRILQEALTNIVRHAGATRVDVSLREEDNRVELHVRDNGRGVTAEDLNDRRAIGLLGMHERAEGVGGTVTITGQVNAGTKVLVVVPLDSANLIAP